MPVKYTCDICGSDEGASMNCDGDVLCRRHHIEHDLALLRSEYQDRRQWVREVWLSRLANMRKEIAVMEKELQQYDAVTPT